MRRFTATSLGHEHELTVRELDDAPGRFALTIDGRERIVDARTLEPGVYSLLVDGAAYLVEIDGRSPDLTVHVRDQSIAISLLDARRKLLAQTAARAGAAGADGPQVVRSPMPGKVVKILVKAGDAIRAGAGVVVVEAMKMENELRAPRDGTVKKILVAEGQAVESGEELAQIE